MISTFHGIEVGKRGLQVHQQGMHVIEHNVSNANTEGYSRQKIDFETFQPLYVPGMSREERPGQVGMGTVVQQIKRVRNEFIDDRIMHETGNNGYWKTMQPNYTQIENIYNESSEFSIRNSLDKVWKSWQGVSQNPDDRAARAVVRQTSKSLATSIQKTFDRLYGLQKNIDNQIKLKVDSINDYAQQISQLNIRIANSKSEGDNPNDMMDKRDLLVEKLSDMINVNVVRTDPDEFMIYVGSQYLVQGKKFRPLEAKGNALHNGFVDVKWKDDGSRVKIENSGIKALLDLRDKVLDHQITQIDNMAINFVDLVNEAHRDGFGLNAKTQMNFFSDIKLTQNRNGNYDFNGDGQIDKTILFKISGTKKLNMESEVGSAGVLNFGPRKPGGEDVLLQYTAKDKIKDIISRINKSKVGVSAYVNHRGRLAIKAALPENKQNMKFVLRHLEDSGDFLVGVSGLLRQRGAVGSYDWNKINEVNKLVGAEKDWSVTPQYHPSRWISISKDIQNDLSNIAVAQGIDTNGDDVFDKPNGVGDNGNALIIAKHRYNNAMIGEKATFDEFFTGLIGTLGSDARGANTQLEKSKLVMKHLQNKRKSISGVSYDEEMANMVMFQHGYSASARLIKTFDSMLDTVINRLRA